MPGARCSAIADPIVHLIRNACDHGLEPEDERLASGKTAAGQIQLSARQTGGEVLITIADDGRGISRERVRAKAEANALIQPGQTLSDSELLQLIFEPGFSTAPQVTNLSGRGVGMDVVKRTIEGLRGQIEVTSEPGKGSIITLRITVGGGISHADALQSHFLPLLRALTRAAAAEFNEDAKALVVSLSRLKETSMQLTSLQGGDRCKNGQGFLELLKCGITDANGMIAQLSQADRQGTVTRAQIMATIDDVTARMAAITELRLEVRNMAINIGLRCRNVGELGKPIAVVANEIRSYSDRLDLIVSAISSAEASLMASSSLMSREGVERPTSFSQLSGLLDIIEACDRSTADALDFVESNSSNVQSSLDRAIMQLQPLVENAELIANVAELLNLPETSDISCGVVVSDELKSIFESLRGKYTMTAEREIHISILKSMGIHDESLDVPVSDEDCGDEFDDGLF